MRKRPEVGGELESTGIRLERVTPVSVPLATRSQSNAQIGSSTYQFEIEEPPHPRSHNTGLLRLGVSSRSVIFDFVASLSRARRISDCSALAKYSDLASSLQIDPFPQTDIHLFTAHHSISSSFPPILSRRRCVSLAQHAEYGKECHAVSPPPSSSSPRSPY